MTPPERFSPTPAICGCCYAPAACVGYRPGFNDPYIWFCDNPACAGAREKVYRMANEAVAKNLEEALWTGGAAGGRYLDGIGTTDLGSLTKDQYAEYLGIVFATTIDDMRARMIAPIAPPS